MNDGAVRSQFLYFSKLSGRAGSLRGLISGHLCNPMNQGVLSLPALTGLAALYDGSRQSTLHDWLVHTLGGPVWRELQADQKEFTEVGLDGMDEQRRHLLASKYAALQGPAAAETAGWLRGEYTFDPACLTD